MIHCELNLSVKGSTCLRIAREECQQDGCISIGVVLSLWCFNLLTSTIQRLSIIFTSNSKREFVPRDQVPQQQHILHLNAVGFKAQSLWGHIKVITNEYRTIIKIGITILTKYNYNKNSKNIQ